MHKENNNDVGTDISLNKFRLKLKKSYLLWVIGFVREHCRNVEHDFYSPPMGEDGVKPCQVVDSVKATLITVETLQPHLVANDRQKVVEGWATKERWF